MTVNNEVGTIEPIPAIGALCRARGVFFHTDAVQAVGHIPVSVKDWQVDALSLSGHKCLPRRRRYISAPNAAAPWSMREAVSSAATAVSPNADKDASA